MGDPVSLDGSQRGLGVKPLHHHNRTARRMHTQAKLYGCCVMSSAGDRYTVSGLMS